MASTTLSIRVSLEIKKWLERIARVRDQKPSTAASRFLEEAFRKERFAGIDFRETSRGRQAFIEGTRLPVWQQS